MKRRDALAMAALVWLEAAQADPSPAERARIDKLIAAVGKRSDMKFIRNGKEYDCAYAAEFLQGKLRWRLGRVNTVQDFIEQIGTRSTTSGEIYTVRLADGSVIPSSEFLQQELKKIEQR